VASFRPIKVLHIIDKLSMDGMNPSSPAILISEWISHLNGNRFNMSVCTLKKPDPVGEFLEEKGVKVYYLGSGKYSINNIAEIMKVIDEEKADIVHLHGYRAANFGRVAARKKGIINIVHEHAILQTLPHQFVADLILRHYTDAAVAVSAGVKDFMIRGRSIPSSKISIIRNGIQLRKCRKSDNATIRKTMAELAIPGDYRIVGTVTRLREEKGNEYLIRAIPSILEQFPDVVFIIVGDGPLRDDLEALAEQLHVSDRVRFLGFRKDVVELLSTFDVNVIASLTEGSPLSLIEAMAVGSAIVATRVQGVSEVVIEQETALCVPPKDPIGIGREVCFLLNNPAIAQNLSNAARVASGQFSLEKSTSLLGELYMKVKAY